MTVQKSIKLPAPDRKKFKKGREALSVEGLEKTAGQFDNKVPIAWFQRGTQVSRAVARIITPSGLGTGWIINGGFVITNNHVISNAHTAEDSRVQFQYEDDINGNPLVPRAFDIEEMLVTNAALDYTILKLAGNAEQDYGFFDISKATPPQPGDINTHFPVVIQHPGGRKKEFSGFENELAKLSETLVWYTSDTEPGSSGSPVLGGIDFSPFALHHAGGPQFINGETKILNEGILLSAIVHDLVTNHSDVAAEMGLQSHEALLDDAAVLWLNRGRVASYVKAVLAGDEEVSEFEMQRMNNAFQCPGCTPGFYDDILTLQKSFSNLSATCDQEVVPVLVAAAGVAAGAAAAHWGHVTSKENMVAAGPNALTTTDFTLSMEGFRISGGGTVFTPVGRGDFGVGLSVEGFSFNGSGGVGLATPVGTVSGGIKVHVENANCIESLYRGVHGLFDVTDPDQQRYFATIQPETEALPVLAGVFIAGVAAGASAYKAGK